MPEPESHPYLWAARADGADADHLLSYFVGFGFDSMKQLRFYCPWILRAGSYLGFMYSPYYDHRYCRFSSYLGAHITFFHKVKP